MGQGSVNVPGVSYPEFLKEKNKKLNKSGDTMTGPLRVRIGTSAGGYVEITEDKEGGTVRVCGPNGTYVYEIDASGDDYVRLHTHTKHPDDVEGRTLWWSAKDGRLGGIGTPTNSDEAVTKEYADTKLPKDGSEAMTGNLAMGGNQITGLGTPTADTDAVPLSVIKTCRIYSAYGLLLNADGGTIAGQGSAIVEINENGLARIDFSIRIETAGTVSSGITWGINRNLLTLVNANIPTIKPLTGGVCTYYTSDGAFAPTSNGLGGTLEKNDNFWRPARVYTMQEPDYIVGSIGAWPETMLEAGMRIVGTCFGTVEL